MEATEQTEILVGDKVEVKVTYLKGKDPWGEVVRVGRGTLTVEFPHPTCGSIRSTILKTAVVGHEAAPEAAPAAAASTGVGAELLALVAFLDPEPAPELPAPECDDDDGWEDPELLAAEWDRYTLKYFDEIS
jgi:hypothetical protein